MFALILCLYAGITPIITSSDDLKLAKIENLNRSIKGFNYKRHTNQARTVKRLTDGKGVDIVVNNSGPASLIADIDSLRERHGVVSLVGFLEEKKADWDPNAILKVMVKCAKIQ